jgi:hypothetical protein
MANSYIIEETIRRPYFINGNVLINNNNFFKSHKCLRIDVPKIYDFPDTIEIKITNKCIHQCLFCSGKSNELGKNKINSELYSKLDNFSYSPVLFIISGGNILENLNDVYDIFEFLDRKFKNCRICIKINAMDLKRLELSSSFGRRLVNRILESSFLCISIDNCKDYNTVLNESKKILWMTDIIYSFDHTISPFNSIERLKGFNVIIDGGIGNLIQKDEIYRFIEKQRYYLKNNSKIFFSKEAYNQLELNKILSEDEKSIYSTGWDNLIYIDAIEGTYSKSKLDSNKVKWDNLSIIDYYHDTYNK